MAISLNSAKLRFGNELRRFREHAGMTQQQLAKAIPLSQSQISGIEQGQKGTTPDQIRRMDDVLNTEGALLRRWQALRRTDGYAEWFRGVVPIEKEATEIRQYQPLVIPGLFQTKEYARSIIQQGRPVAPAPQVAEQVKARLDRQIILNSENGPLIRAVIEEHVLRRPIGGREIMREQLDHLLELSTWERVTIQVVPAATEQHYGMDGAFVLYTVPSKGTVVLTETRVSGTPVDEPSVVEDYAGVFAELRGVALPPVASREFMEQIRGEFHNG